MNYEEMYKELKAELRIHESHDHDRVLAYVKVHKDKLKAAEQILYALGDFNSKVSFIRDTTWL